MSLFKNMKKVDEAKGDTDSLGGGGLFDSGLVDFTIESAFITESKGGATMFNIHLVDENKKVARFNECIVGKTGKNTYERDGTTYYLPGWNVINAITRLSIDKELFDFDDEDTEEKTIKLWNGKERKEMPTKVNMITELVGAPITIGILRQIVDKTQDDGNGKWVPTGETREENAIGKVFHTDTGFTVQELESGVTEDDEPEFRNKWNEKYAGQVVNKAKGNADGGKSGSPTANSGEKKKSSLFGNKNKG